MFIKCYVMEAFVKINITESKRSNQVVNASFYIREKIFDSSLVHYISINFLVGHLTALIRYALTGESFVGILKPR